MANNEDDRVSYINKTIRNYGNKYIYYVTFPNNRKKLVINNSMMHKRIEAKFNEIHS